MRNYFFTGFLVCSTHRMSLLYKHHLVEKTFPFRILLTQSSLIKFFPLLESNPYGLSSGLTVKSHVSLQNKQY